MSDSDNKQPLVAVAASLIRAGGVNPTKIEPPQPGDTVQYHFTQYKLLGSSETELRRARRLRIRRHDQPHGLLRRPRLHDVEPAADARVHGDARVPARQSSVRRSRRQV